MLKSKVKFLDYQIVNTFNGDGFVLCKEGTEKSYEWHLGNYATVEDAKRAAVLYFMIARPEKFATQILHRLMKGGTTSEFYALMDVLEEERIAMPEELVAGENGVLTFKGDKQIFRFKR